MREGGRLRGEIMGNEMRDRREIGEGEEEVGRLRGRLDSSKLKVCRRQFKI